MREIGIAISIAAGLVILAAASRMPFQTALIISVWLIGIGLLVGLPAGVIYHVILYTELKKAGRVPGNWIWKPTAFHPSISSRGRSAFMPYFLIGAAGCGAIFFGSAIAFIAVLIQMSAS